MLRLAKERDELSVVADQHGCPTSAISIAQVLWQLAENYKQDKSLPWGIYHFSNAPACTWHEFAMEIFQQAKEKGLIDKLPKVNAITTAEYPTPAKRPSWSVFSNSKIESLIEKLAPKWQRELTKFLDLIC